MSKVANEMAQVNQISDTLEPLIKKAREAEEEEKKTTEESLARAKADAQVTLTTLGLKLPTIPVPSIQNYLAEQLAKLNTAQLAEANLSTEELLGRNELFQGLNLHISGADIAHGTIGKLLPGKNPLKNPRGVSFKMEDKEVETTKQHALKKKLETTLGLSMSDSTSTSGGVVTPIGGASWSASMSSALSTNTQGSKESGNTSVDTTSIKTCRVTFNARQYALADADYELSTEFERALADVSKKKQNGFQVIREFGSHLTLSAVLGGQYVIEASVMTESLTSLDLKRKAVGRALTARASGAAYAAGFIGEGAGAGSVSSAAATDAVSQKATGNEEEGASSYGQLCLSTYVTGGSPGPLNIWLSAMQQSNNVWEVIDRDVNQLRPIWELVRKSRLLLDPEDQKMVAQALEDAWESNNKRTIQQQMEAEKRAKEKDAERVELNKEKAAKAANEADPTFSDGPTILISVKAPGMCMNLKSGNDSQTPNGDNIHIWSTKSGSYAPQEWILKPTGRGKSVLITSVKAPGMCMNLKSGNDHTPEGNNVHMWSTKSCSHPPQEWVLEPTGVGRHVLIVSVKEPEMCMNLASGNDHTPQGDNIHMWKTKSGSHPPQEWTLRPAA